MVYKHTVNASIMARLQVTDGAETESCTSRETKTSDLAHVSLRKSMFRCSKHTVRSCRCTYSDSIAVSLQPPFRARYFPPAHNGFLNVHSLRSPITNPLS